MSAGQSDCQRRLRDEAGDNGRTLEGGVGRETDTSLLDSDGSDDSIDDLEREPGPVLDRSSVCVRALVGVGLEELVEEVPVRAVDLNTVSSGSLDKVLRRRRVVRGKCLDLGDGESAGDGTSLEGNVRGGDNVERCEDVLDGSTSKSPELHVDEASLGVDYIVTGRQLQRKGSERERK
jgi:hypothetical protein